jgi:hypothetical protein
MKMEYEMKNTIPRSKAENQSRRKKRRLRRRNVMKEISFKSSVKVRTRQSKNRRVTDRTS